MNIASPAHRSAGATLGLDTLAFREPDVARVRRFRALQGGLPLAYGPVGATRGDALPAGWDHDTHEVVLGPASEFPRAADA